MKPCSRCSTHLDILTFFVQWPESYWCEHLFSLFYCPNLTESDCETVRTSALSSTHSHFHRFPPPTSTNVLCRLAVFTVLLCPRVWTSLENGRVTAKPPGPPVEGTVLHYSCHAGFMLEGRNISHCTKLGKWDAPKPTCLCECPQHCVILQNNQHWLAMMQINLIDPKRSVVQSHNEAIKWEWCYKKHFILLKIHY